MFDCDDTAMLSENNKFTGDVQLDNYSFDLENNLDVKEIGKYVG
jgi:hypothetical protein